MERTRGGVIVTPGMPVASAVEVDAIWPAVRAAHLFRDRAEFEAFYDGAPWRVRVDSRGRGMVLDRWRPHLDILAMLGVWASDRALPEVVQAAVGIARSQGYARLLSPLVAAELSRPYERAGMAECARVVALRTDAAAAGRLSPHEVGGVRIRPGTLNDVAPVLAVDAACFDEFWRYGEERIAAALGSERVSVAESADQVIGYTLCTVERGRGTLGRLAVAPSDQGRGVGMALLIDALRWMARAGAASIDLCTQRENVASRSLYAACGLREMPGALVFLVRDV